MESNPVKQILNLTQEYELLIQQQSEALNQRFDILVSITILELELLDEETLDMDELENLMLEIKTLYESELLIKMRIDNVTSTLEIIEQHLRNIPYNARR